jgi:hypothetical protein
MQLRRDGSHKRFRDTRDLEGMIGSHRYVPLQVRFADHANKLMSRRAHEQYCAGHSIPVRPFE